MKPKIELFEAEIEYNVKGKKVSFTIIHNIPNDINLAFESWVYRTKKHNAESFCEYIKSKDLNNIALTKSEYENFNTPDLLNN